MRKKGFFTGFSVFLLFAIFSGMLACFSACSLLNDESLPYIYRDKILQYALENPEFTMADITDFEWDAAYVDMQNYGSGQRPKEKYNLEAELEMLGSDHIRRIMFFSDGVLVNDVHYTTSDFTFATYLEVFYPSTIFYSKESFPGHAALSTYTKINLQESVDILGLSFFEITEYISSNTEVIKYIRTDYDLVPIMTISKIEVSVKANSGTLAPSGSMVLSYSKKNDSNIGGFIGHCRVTIDIESSQITSIENFTGLEEQSPHKTAFRLFDIQNTLNIGFDDVYAMLYGATGLSEYNLPNAEICFENLGKNFLIGTLQNPDGNAAEIVYCSNYSGWELFE